MTTAYCEHPTASLGTITLTASEAGLTGLYLEGHRRGPADRSGWVRGDALLAPVAAQLDEYLAGERRTFELRLAPSAGTAFQRRVWAALEAIPYGETTSYGALAASLGLSRAVRAVGAANGRNPLSIVRPCHRVVGADGSLTGYGGGLAAKRALLALELGAGEHELGCGAAQRAGRELPGRQAARGGYEGDVGAMAAAEHLSRGDHAAVQERPRRVRAVAEL